MLGREYKFINADGSMKLFPRTLEERYTYACEELDRMLEEGHITRRQYYIETRNLEREFYGDDYVS